MHLILKGTIPVQNSLSGQHSEAMVWFWGYLKDKVYSTPPQNTNVLRQSIIDEFNALRQQPDVIRNAVRDIYFVLREMGDTLKDKALDNLIVDTCNINKKGFVRCM